MLKLLLAIVVVALAPAASAAPFLCPQSGHPGQLGGPSNPYLDIAPMTPDSTHSLILTAGLSSFTLGGLEVRTSGHLINVLLLDLGAGFQPPPYNCLSRTLGPLAAGTYDVRLTTVPAAMDAQPVVIANASFEVEPGAPVGDGSLPISGLMTSNWYDPDHSGEGIVVQVAAYPPDDQGLVSKALVFDWFTYDADGNAFWISGNATIDPDDPASVTVPAIFSVAGGFAGDFGAQAMQFPWGTLTFSFPDFDHMTVDYASLPMLGTPPPPVPHDVPSGSGTLHYQRLLNIDGICDPRTLCTQ